ncbi:carboxypeptidase-like regulatory domain-containing protein [Microbacterium sp. VKM Ac-2923]|uniref:carboxypeptidase-like regulatory domain-containing protein n=1 Tax=Microbacterium sp. VKM Ac-2923 TaxID=2929476 RepID=UPI001FB48D21|nr:carboxypeptidase-like regulatory domain-containing protein [Microbacterium sp. VKM Ac-2923]MCJ1707619.1 carboxypeptidase-like regulatory domain-containing protein [Microbacterium sp. VKM Ac-2923]
MSLFSFATVRNPIAVAAAVLILSSGVAVPAHADALEATGAISGRVLLEGPPDAPPAAGTEVYLFPPAVNEQTPTVIATTAADGTFTADVVPEVEYVVAAQVDDGVHVPRNLGATTRRDKGTAFAVAAGETLVLPSYVLPLGATISGRVKTDDGGPVWVSASSGAFGLNFDAQTDANGDYTVRGLELGTYFVTFEGRGSNGEPQQWWPNAPTEGGARPIVVTDVDQAFTGIDADLRAPRTNPLESAPCLDRSTLTFAKAASAARAYLRSHPDLDVRRDLTRADVTRYLARCA